MGFSSTWLVANWKMNGNAARARDWAFAVNTALAMDSPVSCVFCPPATYLAAARAALPHNARLQLGAQNCHSEKSGAYTGEISADMLAEAGCGHVIIGHCERRTIGETDADVLARAYSALAAGLMPIICIGESRAAYDAKQTSAALDVQIKDLKKLPVDKILIAYEPVWAIGSGQTPQTTEIQAAHHHIKSVLGSASCVLYGGSVNAANIGQILGISGVSGVLIGSASLEIESMCAMIAAAITIRRNY